MALGKISGPMLTSNLLRNNEDLSFETNLLYLSVSDPVNYRVGIGTDSPSYLLDVLGTTRSTKITTSEVDIGNVNFKNNIITSIGNLTISAVSNNIVLSSNLTSDYKVFLGSQANATRFPNAQIVISNTAVGIQSNESHNIGLIAEGTGHLTDTNIFGIGVYGVGYTNAATRSGGVVGEGHVSASSDSGSAIGVRGYSLDTHASGMNIGLYGNASGSSIGNYALYMNAGNITNVAAQSWVLGGDLTFSGSYNVNIPNLVSSNIPTSTYIGTTQVALNRASGSLTLAGVNFSTTSVSTSFTVPVGDSSTRPSASVGNIRYNTTYNYYEGYDGLLWGRIGSIVVGDGLSASSIKIANYTANPSELVRVNSSAGSFSITLPASPTDGTVVAILDVTDSCGTNPVNVLPSAGTTIEGDSTSLIIDIAGSYVSLIYNLAVTNWKLQETPVA